MRTLTFLDTETTDKENGRCIEIAFAYSEGKFSHEFQSRFKNPVPISIEAKTVHHITEKMVEKLPLFKDHPEYLNIKRRAEESIVVGHNVKFDMGVLSREGIRVEAFIDTKRVAKHLLPDAHRHNLQYLRYLLDLKVPGRQVAHTAMGDVKVLMALFVYLKTLAEEKYPEAQDVIHTMQMLSQTPALVSRFTFGKHYGKTFQEVFVHEPGYLEYLKNHPGDDEDVNFTVLHWLNLK